MTRYLDLTVTLDGVEPPPWRRFLIAEAATCADLHRAIQDACGWENRHLFEFSSATGTPIAGLPDEDDDVPVPDAAAVRLTSVLRAEGDELGYVYDFGDYWQHTIRCDAVVESDEGFHRRLVAGARAFPPEDCGGVGGYERCVDVLRGGDDDEGVREWLGDWTPERFELDDARRAFDAEWPPMTFLDPRFPAPSQVGGDSAPTVPRPTLVSAAEGVALLDRLRSFTRWVGDGRKLTAKGNLTMAAGAELVDLLGTDDHVDTRIGDRVFKTKSTVELRGVHLVFRLSRSAGFVKVRKGAVSATRRGTELGRDPLADWQAACKGLLDLGVLQHHYAHARWLDPYWKELVDGQVPGMLAHLLVAGHPVPLLDLQERLWQLVEESFVLDDLDSDQLRRHRDVLDRDVRRICRTFADLGAVEVSDVETITTDYGSEAQHGGRVALTPLGVAAVRELTAQT